MEKGSPGGKQSSSCKTVSEGLEEPIHLQQLPPTKSNRNTPAYFISFVTKRFRGKVMCFRVAEAKVLQVLPGWWVQISLPNHHNRQMIRVSHTTDKPGGSSPLLQLEQSLGTYRQLRHSRSDSTPFAPPTHIPLVAGPLPPVSSSVTSALQELQMLLFSAKRAAKKTHHQQQVTWRSSSRSLGETQHCFWKSDM